MTIEINLVGNYGQVFTNYFELRSRKRVQVENDSEIMKAIAEFIVENISDIDAAISDRGLSSRLSNLAELSINDYLSLKFLLAQSGLDILTNIVGEQEVNSEGIDKGILEYNIIDTNYPEESFLHRATKVVTTQESSHISDVYSKIQEVYEFFDTPIFDGYENPMKKQIDLVKETETLIGKSPEGSTMFINSVLDYMGKRIILIINNSL